MNIVNSFLFFVLIPLLLNIEMKTNNYSNLALLYASKHKNWNYQIHSYSRINKNEKKIFFFIPHFHVPNMLREIWDP